MYQKTLSYYITMLYLSLIHIWYVPANSIQFTVEDDGKVQHVFMQDDYTKVQISKTDIATGTEISGAKPKITDADGKTVAEWVTDGTQMCIRDRVIAMDNLSQFLIICEPFLSNRDFSNWLLPTGTSPIIIIAHPPAAILRIFSKYASSESPNVVGAKMILFFSSSPP